MIMMLMMYMVWLTGPERFAFVCSWDAFGVFLHLEGCICLFVSFAVLFKLPAFFGGQSIRFSNLSSECKHCAGVLGTRAQQHWV
jgi:hypothetical protein